MGEREEKKGKMELENIQGWSTEEGAKWGKWCGGGGRR